MVEEAAETVEEKLMRHEDALAACMVEIERLRAENALLRSSEATAHDVLRRIYLDEAQSSGNRIKAAQAALNVEKPKLMPERAPLDLSAEETIPLADLVNLRRARQNQLQGQDIEVLPDGQVLLLDEPNGGNGQGD